MSLHVVTLKRVIILDIAVRAQRSPEGAVAHVRELDVRGRIDWDNNPQKFTSTEYTVHEVKEES